MKTQSKPSSPPSHSVSQSHASAGAHAGAASAQRAPAAAARHSEAPARKDSFEMRATPPVAVPRQAARAAGMQGKNAPTTPGGATTPQSSGGVGGLINKVIGFIRNIISPQPQPPAAGNTGGHNGSHNSNLLYIEGEEGGAQTIPIAGGATSKPVEGKPIRDDDVDPMPIYQA